MSWSPFIVCGGGRFPTTPLTSNSLTPWVSCSSAQFWQSYKAVLPIRHPPQAQAVNLCMLLHETTDWRLPRPPPRTSDTWAASPRCDLCFWLTGYKSEVPTAPSLRSINLLEQLIELRKHIYSLDYRFITKDVKGYESTTRWRDTKGEDLNRGASASWSLGPGMVAGGSVMVPQPGSSPDPVLLGFIPQAWLVKSQAAQLPVPLPSGRSGGGAQSSSSLISTGSLGHKPPYLINITKGTFMALFTCKFQGF